MGAAWWIDGLLVEEMHEQNTIGCRLTIRWQR